MKAHRLELRMTGSVLSIEITDGHGTWALGKESTFSHRVGSTDADSDIMIDEKNDQFGPRISLQSEDVDTNVTAEAFLHVHTSLKTLTVEVNISAGELVKVKGPIDEFIDQGTGTWTHVLQLT
jgi:hypothetical protein